MELAYMAGYFDGEGCVNIHKNHNRVSFSPRIMIGSTDLPGITLFHSAYGGTICHSKLRSIKQKDTWMWAATGAAMEKCLTDLLPFLRVKLDQAKLALEFRKEMSAHRHYVKGRKGTQAIAPEVLARRLEMKQKMHELNRRGRAA